MLKSEKMIWNEIVLSYASNPRDVKTVPMKREGIWFYVYAENDNIYVENARNHSNSSKIKVRRKIQKEELEDMISLHNKRRKGVSVSKEAIEITYNQVYWFGILNDMQI